MGRNTSGLRRGGSRGRPKGVPNKATLVAKEFCSGILNSPKYQTSLINRAVAGKLPPAVETMLWHYAHGKPVEQFEQTGAFTISWQDELTGRLQTARQRVAAAGDSK